MIFGLTVEEAVTLILIVIGVFAVVKVLNVVIFSALKKAAAKTKTQADDIFIRNTQFPITLLAIVIGLHVGFSFLPSFSAYYHLVDLLFKVVYVLIGAKLTIESFNLIISFALMRVVQRPEVDKQILPVIRNVFRAFVYFAAISIILSIFGYDVTALLAGLGIAGLAVALALQNTLSSFFAGFYLLADKPIRVGDYVRLESGEEGFIESIGWRTTRIRTLSNYLVVIPNTKLSEMIIYNYSLPRKETSLIFSIGVDYNSDVDKVEKILKEEVEKLRKTDEGIVKDFKPIVRFSDFGEYSLNFTVIFRIKDFTDRWRIESKFKKNLLKRFKKEKINIPFPTTTVYLKK